MGFYEQRAASALRLIKKYGMNMVLRRVTKGTYHPSAGSTDASTVVDCAAKGIVEEYKVQDIDGTIIKNGDKSVILAASGLAFRPDTNDFLLIGATIVNGVTVGGEPWKIFVNKTTAPGGIDIIHNIQLRN
jgi:hypothetical protein